MKINVHAGHNPAGKVGSGAVGFLRESTENRRIKELVIVKLRMLGHTVYDCTCDDGKSQNDVLKKIVKKCNEHTVDLDVSIHFNAMLSTDYGNGRTTGVETYIYSKNSKAKPYAQKICNAIAALGFRNRGVKINRSFYVLKKTKAPAVLVECCFINDKDDVMLYQPEKMAEAIVYGITS